MIRSALIALTVIFLLLLNLANLFGMIGLSGPVPAMIWFAISFCGVFFLYKFCGAKPVAARIGIFAVAFVGGFFTSVLYYGFFNSQTLEFAFTYALFAVVFTLGIGVIFERALKFSALASNFAAEAQNKLARFCRISKFIRKRQIYILIL